MPFDSRWSAIFFIVYLVLNLYIFMSVFLAVVYNQFKENLKREVRENVERRDALLDKVIIFIILNTFVIIYIYHIKRCLSLSGARASAGSARRASSD